MAAVLASGPDAVLSHVSAGQLWEMLRSRGSQYASSATLAHVTVTRNARHRCGIRVHRSRALTPDHITRRLRIPVTTPSRTLADLRRILPQPQFAAALRQAEFLGLPVDQQLEPDRTRSELEARFLAVCRRHRIPRPDVNVGVGSFTVDFLWPHHCLIVELDGYGSHGGRASFEADRARDVELRLLGYDVVRLTWLQVRDDGAAVAAALRALLARRAQ